MKKIISMVAVLAVALTMSACGENKNTTESTDSSINTTTIEKEIEVIQDNKIVKTDTETIQEEFAEIGLEIEFFECNNQDFIDKTYLSAHGIWTVPIGKITNSTSESKEVCMIKSDDSEKVIDVDFQPGEEFYFVISTNLDTGAKYISTEDFAVYEAKPELTHLVQEYLEVSFSKNETIMDGELEYYYMPLIDDYDEVIQYFTFYYDGNDNIVAFDNEKHFGNAAFADDKHYPLLIDSSGIEWDHATVHYKIYTED